MKFKVLWALTAVASAAPLLPRFDNPGLYFKDGTFQITVLEALHPECDRIYLLISPP